MVTRSPVVVIGLDALEPTAVADESRFPAFASLRRRGGFGRLVGLHDSLPDSAWPEIRTGVSGVRTGWYAAVQFRNGEARPRHARAEELAPERSYWNVAADAGLRVAAIDLPLAPPRPAGPECEISGWGTHERPFGSVRRDAPLRAIVERLGRHPIESCYSLNAGTAKTRAALLGAIHDGIERHTELFRAALGTGTWDLFTAAYGESHCVGHHFWPSRDGEEGDLDRAEPGMRAIDAVYQHLDASLGRLLAAIPAGATVVVYTPEGMGPIDGGALLVGDVLERIGLLAGNRGRRRVSAMVPERWRGAIRKVVGGELLQRAGLTVLRDFGDGSTRAVGLPNPRHGAIRLGIAGRDPGGRLVPGSRELLETIQEIRSVFGELTLGRGGERIVREVVLTDDLLGSDRHPDLPDVIIRFRMDLGMITKCWSPRVGVVGAARRIHRTGDHGTPGAVWMFGPGIAPGTELGDVATIDFAPTVLAALGVVIPPWVEGIPRAGTA